MSIQEDLKAWLDGELSTERAQEVEAAVSQSIDLQQEVQFMRSLSDSIKAFRSEPDAVGKTQTAERVGGPAPAPKRPRFRLGRAVLSGVGVLAALAIVGYVGKALTAPRNSAETASVATREAKVAVPDSDGVLGGLPKDGGRDNDSKSGGSGGSTGTTGGGEFASKVPAEAKSATPAKPDINGLPYSSNRKSRDSVVFSGTNSEEPRGSTGVPRTDDPMFDRKVIKNADISIKVESVKTAQESATLIATTVGGYIEASSLDTSKESDPTAHVTLRVPEKQFNEALRRLQALGSVQGRNITGQDVTSQVADVEARLRTMRIEEDQYRTLLKSTRRIGDVLEVKGRLSEVREQIESLTSQQKVLKNLSSLSTISVNFTEKTQPKRDKPEQGWADETMANAYNMLTGVLTFVGQGIIYLFVLAPIWIPIGGFAWWLNRRANRS